jgi:hypothetical protein
MQNAPSNTSTLIPIIIVFVIFLLRARRMAAARPMSLAALWIRPAIVCVIAALFVYNAPPHGIAQGSVLFAALAAGALAGWYQGKLMTIVVDADTGTLQVKASLIAMATFFGLIIARMALRPWLTSATSPVHAYIGVVTDAFILFFVGFACAQAAEMFIRGRALLSGSRA